jgi:hypothetical protein
VLGREKENCGGDGTSACAGQAAVQRKKLRSHNDLTLRGAARVSIKKFNKYLGCGNAACPNKTNILAKGVT